MLYEECSYCKRCHTPKESLQTEIELIKAKLKELEDEYYVKYMKEDKPE